MNSYTIKTKDVDGNELELDIKKPSGKQIQDAQLVYLSELKKATVDKKLMLRGAIDEILVEQGVWNEEKEQKRKELATKIQKNRLTLQKGGMKFSDGKKLAMDTLKELRKLNELLSAKSEMENSTAESYAEGMRLSYLVSVCVVDPNTEKPYYKDLEDYLNRNEEQATKDATTKFMYVINGIDDPTEEDSPESAFLKRFKLINDKGQLLNKDGHAVDEDGRLINDKWQYVNEEGELVDRDKNRIDEKGNYVVESTPFTDIPEELAQLAV